MTTTLNPKRSPAHRLTTKADYAFAACEKLIEFAGGVNNDPTARQEDYRAAVDYALRALGEKKLIRKEAVT